MYKVIKDVTSESLEETLNQVEEDHRGYVVDQVIPTLAFEQKSVAMVKVSLPSCIMFNIILKQAAR